MSENVDYTNFAMIQAKVVGTPNHLYFHNNNITITRFVDKIDINGTDYLCMGQVSIYSLQNPSDSSLGLLFQCENS